MIRRLLPAEIAVVEGPFADPAEPLAPEEAAAIARAVPARYREFSAGRAFARAALARLGAPPGPLPVGANRAPIWPSGFVGSITHAAGYAAVAIGRTSALLAVGIDIEDSGRFNSALVERIFSPAELSRHLPTASPRELRRVGAATFSAKEAVYKALSTLGEVRLAFADCTIALDEDAGSFSVKLPAGRSVPEFDGVMAGRFAWVGDLVGTAVTIGLDRRGVRGSRPITPAGLH